MVKRIVLRMVTGQFYGQLKARISAGSGQLGHLLIGYFSPHARLRAAEIVFTQVSVGVCDD